jgi:alpha-L-fucosidase
VIWSATWRTYYFSAPIEAIQRMMPGRTLKRDLIGEVADALNCRGIKLMLYYHCDGDREWQTRNFGTTDPNQIGADALFGKNWITIHACKEQDECRTAVAWCNSSQSRRFGRSLSHWCAERNWSSRSLGGIRCRRR